MSKLSTIHDAIREASMEARTESERLKPATYKVADSIKEQAEEICANNGTTLSGFLRNCCTLLVLDYNPRAFGQESDDLPLLPSGQK